MPLARIVHWRPAESGGLVRACKASGWKIDYPADASGSAVTRGIKENIPDAVVIDLSRAHTHGREIAIWLRNTKRTRHIPIVFANGDERKVEALKQLLPDATFTTTDEVANVLQSLPGREMAEPVVPVRMMARYGTKTTAEKLGLRPGSTTGLVNPPRVYGAVVGPLPDGAELIENPRSVQLVTLWFVYDMEALPYALRRMHTIADKTKLWIVWSKASKNGLTPDGIRQLAIEAGLVDYKVCALGGDWSGILFARRKK